jgi:small GTP-binding protein
VFKVILVGVQAVGKSSILCRLVNSQLANSYQATVGIDYHSYATVVNKKSLSLQIWDTAGQ